MRKGLLKYFIVLMVSAILVLTTLVIAVIYGNEKNDPSETKPVQNQPSVKPSDASSTKEATVSPSSDAPTEGPSEEEPTVPPTEPEPSDEVLRLPHYEMVQDTEVVFVGESRTLFLGSQSAGGIKGSGVVSNDLILAKFGALVTDNESSMNTRIAAGANKKKVVFWFGINDVQLREDRDSADAFIEDYQKLLDEFLSITHKCEVYILSILPTGSASSRYYEGQEQNIDAYNAALKTWCAQNGYNYVDLSSVYKGESDLQADGVHFTNAFYKRLIVFMENRIGFMRTREMESTAAN